MLCGMQLRVDAISRAREIAFFTAHSFGFDGVVFADLGKHLYRRTPVGTSGAAPAPASDPITVDFPSLAAAHQVQWGSLQSTRKRGPQIPKVYIKHQRTCSYIVLIMQAWSAYTETDKRCLMSLNIAVLQEHRTQTGETEVKGVSAFVAFAQAQLQAQGLPADFFSAKELRFVHFVLSCYEPPAMPFI